MLATDGEAHEANNFASFLRQVTDLLNGVHRDQVNRQELLQHPVQGWDASGALRLVKHHFTRLGQLSSEFVPAKGAGSHGRRMGDIAGYNTNIEIKTIVSSGLSDQLLEELKPFQETHALIVFRQTVEGLFD